MQRCTLRLSVLWRKPHKFLVSLHVHDTTYSFRISPCPLCSLRWISGLWHSTEIDSRRCLLRLLIILGQTHQFSWQVNNWRVFRGLLCRVSFLDLLTVRFPPSTLLSSAVASAMIPTGQAEKTLQRRERPISYD